MRSEVLKDADKKVPSGLKAARKRFIREQVLERKHRRTCRRDMSMWLCARCKAALRDYDDEVDEVEGVLRAIERATILPPIYARLRRDAA